MGKHHGKGGKSGLGKTLGIVGFAAGFAFPGAFLGAAAGTAVAARLSAALMGLSLGTTIGSAFAKQSQDMPASNFDNKMNVVDQNAMIPVVYGTRKIGGLQSYHSTSVKHKTLIKDVILGEGQFSGCYGITANGYSVNSNVSGAVFGITNTNNANAYVRVHDGKLEFDTNGASVGVYNRGSGWLAPWFRRWLDKQVQKNGGYRKIDLQSSDDIKDDESNDFQCYIAKMYQYIEGIRYDNDLAALGWKLVNPIVVDDAPKHLNNTDWVNVGNGKIAWFSMNHDETKDSYITFYDGTQGAPSYYMKTGAYPNMSYLHAYLKYTEKLGNGNPTVTCIAKGRKVYDTRTNTWGYSENPAMIIRDYLINTTFGSGRYINQSMIDEDSFKDAANYCDEKVTSFDTQGRSITEPRYRLNIVINSKRSYLENLQSMLACCAGYLVFTKGQVAMRIERADNPVYAFDDDNIIQNSMSYTAASSTESPNKLNMKYIEPTLDWTSVSAIVEDLADQKQQPVGRGKIVEKDVELIGVTSQCQALRLGKIYRDLIRLCPISIEFKTAMQALNLEPGDVVTISHNVVLEDNKVQPLFKDMPVRITEIRDDSGIYTIKAQQYNASIYDDRMGGNLKDYDYTTIKKPTDLLPKAVPNVKNLKAYTIYKQGRDGVANYDLVVTYDLPSGYLLETGMVYYKCNEGYDLSTLGVIPEGVTGTEVGFANDWKFAGEGPSRLVIPNVHIGVTYKLLVQARSKSGNKAPMIDCPTVTITVEKKTTIPNKPANLSIKYTDVATVSWEGVTNSDIDYYEVRTNKDTGKDDGLLARTSDTSVVVPLASRTGTIYVFGHNTSKLHGYPAILEYSKALPPKPNAPTVVSKLGALGITTDEIPSDCSGVKIHINHDIVTSTNNTVQYPCNAGIYNVSYGFYDLFGEGKVSEETTVVVKVLVDQKLLEDGAVSIKKVDETVTKAIEDASNNYKEDLSSVSADLSNTKEDLSSVSADLSNTKEDLSKTKTNLNTVASDLSTKSKELSDEITGVKQNITGLTSTVNNNAGNISQLQQRATDIETTVADNNKKLSSQITQNANSISTVVANLNNTDLANSPYRSITQLKQTTDSISSTVSANKSAQDSVNSSLTSKIQQNANSVTSIIANLSDVDKAKKNYSAISQLQDDINLRVAKGDVISQINLDKTGATIDGKLLHVTGDTVIEKNVIAKGMIQAGAVTADNMAAETINLTDKLKIQGNNVTLDENGLSVDMQNEGKINFGSGGMTVSDSSGNLYSAIRRVCMGMAKNGNYIAFDPPWEVEPSVLVFPQTIVTADTSRSNTVQRLHCYADEISKNGFRIHVYEGIDTTDYTTIVNKIILKETKKVYRPYDTVGPWDANFSFNIPTGAKEINLVMTVSGTAHYKGNNCITINRKGWPHGTSYLTVYADNTVIYSGSNFITGFSVGGHSSNRSTYQTGPLKINGQTNIHGTLRVTPGVNHPGDDGDNMDLSVSVDYAQGYRDTGSASSIIDSDCNAIFFATDKVSSGYTVS